ncbi:hypothetical protein [Tumebacillus permanentifrigoris]|uniref:Uncharacterized protein n=1 Tax=Tumebacillus permanentifrigoris TaxID=378543 RepID=A0A316D8E1_9BACL|nr:hypothetical protein [Tumebacillus permanentifrigoris]PWK10188.1 hypothetical protein C7459_1129 [Tumebacillus permanentifrigoris]
MGKRGKRPSIDARNEKAIRAALAKRSGEAEVRSLKLICSDDETVCEIIQNMPGLIKPKLVIPTSIVRLAR